MNKNQLPLGVKREYFSELSPDQVSVLRRLESRPLDIVRPKLVENPLFADSNLIDRYIVYYKHFMFFKGCEIVRTCGLHSIRVDAVWHTHLLYTEDYADFCHTVFGRFIHHTPCDLLELTDANVWEWNDWMFNIYPDAFEDVCPLESPDAPIRCG